MRLLLPAFLLLAQSTLAQTWQQLPDFPGTARDDAAAFTLGNKIYVGTGMEVGWGLTNDWWCFDAATDTWSAIASMPTTPRQYCAAFTVNDTGYVFGGVEGSGALNELWAYYPAANQWEQKSPMPAEARYACAALEAWNYGIVATGMLLSGVPTKEAWKYFPATDTWQAMNPVPGPSRHRAVAFHDAGGMVIAGGADSTGTALRDAWSYPVWFETGTYYQSDSLPGPRIDAKSGAEVMVVAGGASDANTFHDDVWSGGTGAWTTLPSFPGGPRRGAAGAGVVEGFYGTFYFGLGLDNDLTRHKDWWRLDLDVGIDEQHEQKLGLFPNPATQMVTLDLPAAWQGARLRIFDALGREVIDQQVNRDARLNVSALSTGRYVVEAEHGSIVLRGILIKLP